MMMETRLFPLLVLLLLGVPAADAAVIELAPHRAFYELHLNQLDEGSNIADAQGALAVDWSRSCEGWTVDQRLALVVEENSGATSRTEIVFSSFESLDGLTYNFTSRTTRDGQMIDEYRGLPLSGGRSRVTSTLGLVDIGSPLVPSIRSAMFWRWRIM